MNYFLIPHPDDTCYNSLIRIYESDYDDEKEQDINDFCEGEYEIEDLITSKNN
jgi:hypothetical protein